MQDCPESNKVSFPTKTPDINGYPHEFFANSLPQWIVDMGATKHIVEDKASFVEFHRYTVVCHFREWKRGRCPWSRNIPA